MLSISINSELSFCGWSHLSNGEWTDVLGTIIPILTSRNLEKSHRRYHEELYCNAVGNHHSDNKIHNIVQSCLQSAKFIRNMVLIGILCTIVRTKRCWCNQYSEITQRAYSQQKSSTVFS